MSVQQKIIFQKLGLDSDTTDELKSGFVNLFNVRILNTNDATGGSVTTVNGNTPVLFSLPNGVNTCIGYCEDKLRTKSYGFIYNDIGNHSIVEYDGSLRTMRYVLRNKPSFDSTSTPLNFNIDFLIFSCFVFELDADNHLLYWTDNYHTDDFKTYNEPKKINIEKGVLYMSSSGTDTNGYITPFDAHWIDRIKASPDAPSYVWSGIDNPSAEVDVQMHEFIDQTITAFTDTAITFNQIITNVNIPPPQWDGTTYLFTAARNGYYNLQIQLWVWSTYVSSYTTSQFDLNKNGVSVSSQILSLSPAIYGNNVLFSLTNYYLSAGDTIQVTGKILSTSIVGAGVRIFTDTFTHRVSFLKEYYIGATLNLDNNFLFKRLFQFQARFGYDDKELSALSPKCDYVLPKTALNPIYSTGEDYIYQDKIITITVQTGSANVTDIYVYAHEINYQETDTISGTSQIAHLNKKDLNIADNTTYSFTFLNDGNYIPLDLQSATQLYDNIFYFEKCHSLIKNKIADGNGADNTDAVNVDMRFPVTYDETVYTNPNSFFPARSYYKSGSIYQEAIEYIFNGKRLSNASTANGYSDEINSNGIYGTRVKIPFLNEVGYDSPVTFPNRKMEYVPTVSSYIYHAPPSDAIGYSILRSKSQNIQKYIQFLSENITFRDVNNGSCAQSVAAFADIFIGNIIGRYKGENPASQLVYEWTKGDRIRFISYRVDSNTIGQFYTFNDTEITNFDAGNQRVTILMSPSIPASLGAQCLYEIYTPAKSITNDNEIVYEVGETGTIGTDAFGNKIHIPTTNGLTTKNQLFSDFLTITYNGGTSRYDLTCTAGHEIAVGRNVKVSGGSGSNTWSFYGDVYSSSSGSMSITPITTSVWKSNIGVTITGAGKIVASSEQVFTSGDCFRRYCDMPYETPTVYRLYSYIETMDASNMWSSQAWDYGRPNRIDNVVKRLIRKASVTWSENVIPDTQINGLSTVYDTSIQDYNQSFGGIENMLFINDRLELYQQTKVLSILIEQQLIESQVGQPITASAPPVLSPQGQYATYYLKNFGTIHPESLANFEFRSYFFDVNNAAIVRRSDNGLTNLPMESNMRVYFADLCSKILQAEFPNKVKCIGVYDVNHQEYILCINSFSYGSEQTFEGVTIAWNEKYNQFSTFYGYIPDYIGASNNDLVSFRTLHNNSACLWVHNINPLQNNFYGVQQHSEIAFNVNLDPSKVKVLEAVSQETNKNWVCSEISTPNNQLTNMIYDSQWVMKENNFYAYVCRDVNTPNVLNPIVEGDVMRDRTFKVTMRYDKSDYSKLYAVNTYLIPSERSNR